MVLENKQEKWNYSKRPNNKENENPQLVRNYLTLIRKNLSSLFHSSWQSLVTLQTQYGSEISLVLCQQPMSTGL
jgi:hypothetical protein